jgi:hypothetical protein
VWGVAFIVYGLMLVFERTRPVGFAFGAFLYAVFAVSLLATVGGNNPKNVFAIVALIDMVPFHLFSIRTAEAIKMAHAGQRVNATTLGAIGTVVAIATAVWSAFLLARSNTRDNIRMRQEERDKAVADAKAPLIADNERLSAELAVAKVRITSARGLALQQPSRRACQVRQQQQRQSAARRAERWPWIWAGIAVVLAIAVISLVVGIVLRVGRRRRRARDGAGEVGGGRRRRSVRR